MHASTHLRGQQGPQSDVGISVVHVQYVYDIFPSVQILEFLAACVCDEEDYTLRRKAKINLR
jgi:hypothetical protein